MNSPTSQSQDMLGSDGNCWMNIMSHCNYDELITLRSACRQLIEIGDRRETICLLMKMRRINQEYLVVRPQIFREYIWLYNTQYLTRDWELFHSKEMAYQLATKNGDLGFFQKFPIPNLEEQSEMLSEFDQPSPETYDSLEKSVKYEATRRFSQAVARNHSSLSFHFLLLMVEYYDQDTLASELASQFAIFKTETNDSLVDEFLRIFTESIEDSKEDAYWIYILGNQISGLTNEKLIKFCKKSFIGVYSGDFLDMDFLMVEYSRHSEIMFCLARIPETGAIEMLSLINGIDPDKKICHVEWCSTQSKYLHSSAIKGFMIRALIEQNFSLWEELLKDHLKRITNWKDLLNELIDQCLEIFLVQSLKFTVEHLRCINRVHTCKANLARVIFERGDLEAVKLYYHSGSRQDHFTMAMKYYRYDVVKELREFQSDIWDVTYHLAYIKTWALIKWSHQLFPAANQDEKLFTYFEVLRSYMREGHPKSLAHVLTMIPFGHLIDWEHLARFSRREDGIRKENIQILRNKELEMLEEGEMPSTWGLE
ncbi:Hypothetical protein POVR1_LOCUS300 [uncultured virus]|nr:Hypothetical protein POVR1_LOCUS300 [uncultured virus]